MRGYVILAQNTETTNYVECAERLAESIRKFNQNVTIITELPYGDQAPDSNWKLINDWQVYEASPYDETIKLEADMYIPNNIDYYFDMFNHMDVCVCDTIRNYRGEISDIKFYRKFIVDNNLPDVYNAMTYFKKSQFAEEFFKLVKEIFINWEDYKKILICNADEPVTTDWVYAIACHIMGTDKTTMPNGFSMVHMKQFINGLYLENWTDELIYEFNPFRIQMVTQMYPVHYYIKEFAKELNGRI